MALETLGTIKGQMILDVKQALAAYTAARLAHLQTVTALSTGAGALRGVGVGLTAAGAGLGAGLIVATKAAADFEKRLDFFGAVSAATQDEMDGIREKALELGKDTIFSAGQIADSFVELGKAGVSAEDIINGIGEGVAALGAAADIPLDTAANIITSAVQTFGLSADHAVEVADKLAGAANASIVEVQDLGLSLKYAGGVASALGIDFEEVNTALGLLGTYGIRGSTAGTSLRQTLISLTGATDKAKNRLRELGVITESGRNRFFNADGSAKTLAETFQILQDATADMTQEARVAAFKDIFQTRALPTVIALTKAGADGFAEMNAEINKTTAAEVAGKRLDNLAGDVEVLRGNLETLAIEAGSQLQEFARDVVQQVTKLVQIFSDLSPEMQKNIIQFAAWTAAILLVVGILGLVSSAVLNIIGVLLRLGPVFTLLGKGLQILVVGFRALTVAMLTNPIGLILVLIGLLIAAFIYLWNNNEGFRNFFIAMWEGIKVAAAAVVEWFKGLGPFFRDLWNNIKTGTQIIWNSILDFIKGIPQFLLNLFLNFTLPGLIIKYWDDILLGTQLVWNAIVEFFRTLPERIVSFFQQLPERIGYFLGFMVGTAIRLIIELYETVTHWVLQTTLDVIAFFQKLPGRVNAFFRALYENAKKWIIQTAVDVLIWTIRLYQDVIDWLSKLPGRVAKFFSDLYNNARSWLIRAWNTAVQMAANIYNGIVNFIQRLPGRVATFFSNVLKKITTASSNGAKSAKRMGQNIYDGIIDFITGLPGEVAKIFNNAVGAIKDVIYAAFQAAKDFAAGLWNGFRDGLGIHSPSYIEEAMWAITGVVDEEANHLSNSVRYLQGLGNNISEVGDNLTLGTGDLDKDLLVLASQIRDAQAFQNELGAMAATATFTPSVAVTSTQAVTLDSIDKTLKALANRPQRVVNQDITVNNPTTEPDSVAVDDSLQQALVD